jgi:hypothetical protein
MSQIAAIEEERIARHAQHLWNICFEPRRNYPGSLALLGDSISTEERFMNKVLIGLSAAAALTFASHVAFADGDGAIKGGVGGAVAGALVGGPVGAAVGGAAGMAVGGAATSPDRTVVVQPAPGQSNTVIERRAADVPSDTKTITRDGAGCVTRSDQKTNGMGDSVTRTQSNC